MTGLLILWMWFFPQNLPEIEYERWSGSCEDSEIDHSWVVLQLTRATDVEVFCLERKTIFRFYSVCQVPFRYGQPLSFPNHPEHEKYLWSGKVILIQDVILRHSDSTFEFDSFLLATPESVRGYSITAERKHPRIL